MKGGLELLTPQEREWAFKLEEALFEGDGDAGGTGTGNGPRRGAVARIRNSLRTSITSTTSTSASASITSSTRKNNNNNLLYGKPSDLEIAAHAIRAKGNIPKALKRLKRMKVFKDTYNVPDFDYNKYNEYGNDNDENENDNNDNDNDNDANWQRQLKVMKKVFVTAYPDFLQRIGLDRHGRVTIALRVNGLRWSQPPPFNHTETERFQAFFFLLNTTQPTLEAIRRGTVWIGDCEGLLSTTTTNGGGGRRPSPSVNRGGRMLLRDAYPIKVQDVPVVDCPSPFSNLYALGLYPFFSSHFASKLVRVTPRVLQQHFPEDLLSERMSNNGRKTNNNKKNKHASASASGTKGSRGNNNNNNVVVGSSNGDEYDNTWENLDDDDDDDDPHADNDNDNGNSTNDKDKDNDNGKNNKGKNDNDNDDTDNELWTRVERLLRMRFETERNFRII